MRFMIVVLALVAAIAAEPEADPDPYFYSGHRSYTPGGYVGGYSGFNRGFGSYYNPYTTYSHALHSIYKREADSEPEADPLAGGYTYSNIGYPYSSVGYPYYNSAVRSAYVNTPVVRSSYIGAPLVKTAYSVKPRVTHGYSHHFGKRSADAEPYNIYSYPGYSAYNTGYNGYNMGYNGYNIGGVYPGFAYGK